MAPNSEPNAQSLDAAENNDLQAIFRRHFEARFKPLPEDCKPKAQKTALVEDEDEDEEDSEWSGFSDEREDEAVDVVDHSLGVAATTEISKEELKAFMVWCQSAFPL